MRRLTLLGKEGSHVSPLVFSQKNMMYKKKKSFGDSQGFPSTYTDDEMVWIAQRACVFPPLHLRTFLNLFLPYERG